MDATIFTYRPSEQGNQRLQLFLGALLVVLWFSVVIARLAAGELGMFGGFAAVAAVAYLLRLVLLRRGGIHVGPEGLRWSGGLRTTAIRWAEAEEVVLTDRGWPHGSKVGVDVRTRDEKVRSVPFDALAGLEDRTRVERKEAVLAAVARAAEANGVPVRRVGADDALA